jgi:hypothetical protein
MPTYTDFDASILFNLGDSIVTTAVLSLYDKGLNPPVYWVYFGVVMMLFMSYCSAAYVAYITVQHAISTTEGFYHIYADYSSFGNQMFLYEALATSALLLWSFFTVVMATWAGSNQWKLMDERFAESQQFVVNSETPLGWDKGMKAWMQCVVAGFGAIISAVAFGETADQLIAYFDGYDDKTNTECSDSSCDTPGTSAQTDIVAHLITVFYSWFVISAISLGGYIFMLSYTNFDDDFDCTFVDGIDISHYYPIFGVLGSVTNYDECMA